MYDESDPTKLHLEMLHFFINGILVIFAAYFPLYFQDYGMNKTEIGGLMALGPLISLVAHPFWGYWTNRRQSAKPVLIALLIGLLISGHFLLSVDKDQMLYFTLIIFYFFLTPLLTQSHTVTLDISLDSNQEFRNYRIYGSLGWTVTALIVSPFVGISDPLGLSIAFGLVTLIALGITVLLPAQKRKENRISWPSYREFLGGLQNKYFVAVLILGLLVAVPNAINSMFMPLYMIDLGGTPRYVGLAVFLSTLLEVATFVLIRKFLKRKLTYLLGCLTIVSLIFTLRWQLMSMVTHPLQIVFIQLLHSVAFGGFFYVGTEVTNILLPRPYHSAGQAIYVIGWSGLAGIAAGPLGGWMFQNFGAITLYKTNVTLTLCGALGFALMWYHLRHHGYTRIFLKQRDET